MSKKTPEQNQSPEQPQEPVKAPAPDLKEMAEAAAKAIRESQSSPDLVTPGFAITVLSEPHDQWAKAMFEVQKAMPEAVKTAYNKHTNSKYTDLKALLDVAKPFMHENNLLTLHSGTRVVEGLAMVETRIIHVPSMQQSLTYSQMRMGKDDPQGFQSTFTYGKKGNIKGLLNITEIGEDDDGHGGSGNVEPAKAGKAAAAEAKAKNSYNHINTGGDLPSGKAPPAARAKKFKDDLPPPDPAGPMGDPDEQLRVDLLRKVSEMLKDGFVGAAGDVCKQILAESFGGKAFKELSLEEAGRMKVIVLQRFKDQNKQTDQVDG